MNVNVNVVRIVRNVMPNKAAKKRKQERRKKNEYFNRHGRTRKQIERFKRREKNGSSTNNR